MSLNPTCVAATGRPHDHRRTRSETPLADSTFSELRISQWSEKPCKSGVYRLLTNLATSKTGANAQAAPTSRIPKP